MNISVRRTILGLAAASLTGCSFISMAPTPSVPPDTPAGARPKTTCHHIAPPLADTLSAAAGASFILGANRLANESRPLQLEDTNRGMVITYGAPRDNYDWLRYTGYGTLAVFGLSALYGYYRLARCDSDLKAAEAELEHAAPIHAPRADPPTVLFGFSFKMDAATAAKACADKRAEWKLEGGSALCRPRAETAQDPAVVLDFESDEVRRITLLRRPTAAQLEQWYEDLYKQLRALYGAPQLDRGPLSGTCTRSLSDCLQHGETPKGALWHWPTETVELQPLWSDSGALLQERYTVEAQVL